MHVSTNNPSYWSPPTKPDRSVVAKRLRIFSGLVLILLLLGLLFRQEITDQIAFWRYQPTDKVASFAVRTGLSERGKFYLYASHATVQPAQEFNEACDGIEYTAAVLGCYTATGRIYVYDIKNDELDGIMDVAAAHEMLHAAYQRLSARDRKHIDTLLQAEYTRLKDEPAFASHLASYGKLSAVELSSELHSIIGTEVDKISTELDQHYARYFTDRQACVRLHQKIAKVFYEIERRSKELVDQANRLAMNIQTDKEAYTAGITQLGAAYDVLERQIRLKQLSSDAANREIVRLQREYDRLDSLRLSINQRVGEFQTYKTQIDELSLHADKINTSINSKLAPSAATMHP